MARPNPQDLLREFAGLNRRRRGEGISPLELQRWSDLHRQLARAFPDRPPLGTGGTVRVRVEYPNEAELREAIMVNVRPMGLFVHTPFAPEAGYEFTLCVFVKETGQTYDGSVTVVSKNIGPDFSTESLGMGLRSTKSDSTLQAALDRLYGPGDAAA
jgi:hypothetical protein